MLDPLRVLLCTTKNIRGEGDMEIQHKISGKVGEAGGDIRGVMCHKDRKKREELREREKSGWKGNYGNEGHHVQRDRNERDGAAH